MPGREPVTQGAHQRSGLRPGSGHQQLDHCAGEAGPGQGQGQKPQRTPGAASPAGQHTGREEQRDQHQRGAQVDDDLHDRRHPWFTVLDQEPRNGVVEADQLVAGHHVLGDGAERGAEQGEDGQLGGEDQSQRGRRIEAAGEEVQLAGVAALQAHDRRRGGEATQRRERPIRMVGAPAGGHRESGEQHNSDAQQQAGPAGETLDPLIGVSGQKSEVDEPGRPGQRAEGVEGKEGAVGHAAGPGDERHQRAEHPDEAAQEHRRATAPAHVLLGAFPPRLLDAPAQPATAQRIAETPAQLVAGGVPDDRAEYAAGHHQREAGPAGECQDPAEQHRGLARDDQPDERRGLKPGEHPDQDVAPGSGQVQQPLDQPVHLPPPRFTGRLIRVGPGHW